MKGKEEIINFKRGVKDGLPIGLGYLSVSLAFGVQASLLGIPVLITLLTSMTNLTSAGQLAGIQIIATLGSFVEIILVQLVINSRYFLMSLSLSQKLEDNFSTVSRFLTSAFITDEIFGVASSKKGKLNAKYMYGLALLPYIGWSLGTIIGGLAGAFLPTGVTNALGIALYAMFIAIIVPPAIKEKGVLLVVLLGAGLSCAFYYIPFLSVISNGFAIIISAVVASLVIAWIFPIKDQEDSQEISSEEQVLTEENIEADQKVAPSEKEGDKDE